MKNSVLEEIKNNKCSYAIFDFDYTLTLSNSNSSIGVFSNYLPNSYKNKKMKIDFITDHVSNKHIIKLMWWLKLKLLSKYYSKEVLNKIRYKEEFYLNKKTINILKKLKDRNVNIIIYSSGLKEIILNVLKLNNIDIKNVKIFANDIDIKTKKINSNIITPNKEKLSDIKYSYSVLFGDKKEDLKILKDALKFKVNDEKIELYVGD